MADRRASTDTMSVTVGTCVQCARITLVTITGRRASVGAHDNCPGSGRPPRGHL